MLYLWNLAGHLRRQNNHPTRPPQPPTRSTKKLLHEFAIRQRPLAFTANKWKRTWPKYWLQDHIEGVKYREEAIMEESNFHDTVLGVWRQIIRSGVIKEKIVQSGLCWVLRLMGYFKHNDRQQIQIDSSGLYFCDKTAPVLCWSYHNKNDMQLKRPLGSILIDSLYCDCHAWIFVSLRTRHESRACAQAHKSRKQPLEDGGTGREFLFYSHSRRVFKIIACPVFLLSRVSSQRYFSLTKALRLRTAHWIRAGVAGVLFRVCAIFHIMNEWIIELMTPDKCTRHHYLFLPWWTAVG